LLAVWEARLLAAKSKKNWTRLWGGGTYPHSPAAHSKKPAAPPCCSSPPLLSAFLSPPPFQVCERNPNIVTYIHAASIWRRWFERFVFACFDLAQMIQKICICILRSGADLPRSSISSLWYLATSLGLSSNQEILMCASCFFKNIVYTYDSDSISQMWTCSDDPIELSSGESDFSSRDYMASDEEPIERQLVHICMKNMNIWTILYL
jgi:hypothetical protein